MPDSIYLGEKTHLITENDNDSIKGIRTSDVAPTHAGLRLLGKKPHLRVKVNGQVRKQLISSQASKAKGRVSTTHHRP
jgi:hypothetical protein